MPELVSSSMTIGARSLLGEYQYDVRNPATGRAFASAPICSEIELKEAVQTAATLPRLSAASNSRALDANWESGAFSK